jgi:NAD(P)-dependent dehydrogenase (short-subunit alcohol dehydrogenase family)
MLRPEPDPPAPFAFDFSGQVAVITGGGRGIGLEFARALSAHGASVILGDIDRETGERAAQTLRESYGDAQFVPLDVREPTDNAAAAAFALDHYQRLDIWVNNAGIARHGASATYAPDAWKLCIDIMLSGTFYGAQAASAPMIAQHNGCIINIASVNGLIAQSGRASYAAAKAGVIRLTEVLAAEWASCGVRVNAIAPAVFLTDLARTSFADGSASMDVYLNRSPSGRLGELPELIPALLFLASPFSGDITGQTLRVDGAWTADHYL